MRGFDGRIVACCAAFTGATGDLGGIGGIGELIVHHKDESPHPTKRGCYGEALPALLYCDGQMFLLGHALHLLFSMESYFIVSEFDAARKRYALIE